MAISGSANLQKCRQTFWHGEGIDNYLAAQSAAEVRTQQQGERRNRRFRV